MEFTHDGATLRYLRRTHGDGRVRVVFVQGVGVGAEGWLPQLDGLSDGEHPIAGFDGVSLENRGFGQPLVGKLNVARMADDVLALMDHLGWPSAHLVGHSLGGLVVLDAALRAKGRVQSLGLLCTFAAGAVPTRLSWAITSIGVRSRVGTARMRRRAFLELVAPPAALGDDPDGLAARLAPFFGHDLADQPSIALRQVMAMRACDLRDRLAELRGVRTLVVSAEHDVLAPPWAGRALAEGHGEARYVELPGASHGVTIMDAARVNALLRDHLTG